MADSEMVATAAWPPAALSLVMDADVHEGPRSFVELSPYLSVSWLPKITERSGQGAARVLGCSRCAHSTGTLHA